MRRVLIAIVPLLAAGAVLPATTTASADAIANKRDEARRIARELEARAERVAVLAEEFNIARMEADRVDALAGEAQARSARASADADKAKARLRGQAVAAYMQSGTAQALSMLAQSRRIDDLGVRHHYVRSATASTADAIDELRAARTRLDDERASLSYAQAAAHRALDEVGDRRAEADSAQDAQRRLLARVKGELSALVAAESRRRADEAARQARADLARRQEREAASRRVAAVTTTTATSTTVRTNPSPPTTVKPPNPPPAAPGSAPSSRADTAVAEARRQLGKPYHYGGSGPDSFDCSGLTSWAWKAAGLTLPHSSRAQWSATDRVAIGELAPGDIVFYGDPIYHVGIYVGNGEMIEASETGTPVRQTTIFRKDLVGAGRVT